MAFLTGPDFAVMAHLTLCQALGSQNEICSYKATQKTRHRGKQEANSFQAAEEESSSFHEAQEILT